eukprot:3623805-Prymnesium_polylepis.1
MPALVRFDSEHAYGDADDAWQEVALTIGNSDVKVLICDVAIAEVCRGPRAAPTMLSTPTVTRAEL